MVRKLLKSGADVNCRVRFLDSKSLRLPKRELEPGDPYLVGRLVDVILDVGGEAESRQKHRHHRVGELKPLSFVIDVKAADQQEDEEEEPETPLHVAAWISDSSKARMLAEAGADINAMSRYGTVLTMASAADRAESNGRAIRPAYGSASFSKSALDKLYLKFTSS